MSRAATADMAVLTIDLDALAQNWRTLADLAKPARCAAAVKADGYGLGAAEVGPALARAGCRTFFVAHLDEGIALRKRLRRADIYVLHGPPEDGIGEMVERRLIPVLNSPPQVARWRAAAAAHGRLAAALHVDTGMNRLGLAPAELEALAAEPQRLDGIDLTYVMSHLACAEEPASPLNREQFDRFQAARRRLPGTPASLANSGGILLGPDFHFDLVRPGIALYGVNPTPFHPLELAEVVQMQGKILQVRNVDAPMTVGYGATHLVARPGRIATIAVGYADGFLRTLSNQGHAFMGDFRVPVVGRVSMDLITLDVTAVPEALAQPGAAVQLIGGQRPLTEVAAEAGTNEYEILTRLGRRFHRVYRGTK